MAKLILLDTRVLVGAADLSGQSNKLELTDEIEEKDVTHFRSGGAKEVLGGLETVSIGAEGQWEAGDPGKVDDQAWASRRVLDAWTMGATGASDTAAGSLAYIAKALRTSFAILGAVGNVAPWSANATGTWPLVRGAFAHPSGVARTASGTGTALNLGALGAGERLYASLHVLSVAGTTPTIDVTVTSDSAELFNASPETRITFPQASEASGTILRTAAGAHLDDWYRAEWTISASGGESFLFVVAIGIE